MQGVVQVSTFWVGGAHAVTRQTAFLAGLDGTASGHNLLVTAELTRAPRCLGLDALGGRLHNLYDLYNIHGLYGSTALRPPPPPWPCPQACSPYACL
ncbi:hypothetical protein GQ600_20531 [Phytophthora cactorum]|nr:hypothetical protein GQ600_20531 [Phytophthora cactorum]